MRTAMIASSFRFSTSGFFAVALACACTVASADVRLPAPFSDGLVLQRNSEVSVWGSADPGERVTVRGGWGGPEVEAVADAKGSWRIRIATLDPGGPHTLTVSGKNSIVIQDVLVGEVWLCSGQSNMEWPTESIACPEELRSAELSNVRLFDVENRVSPTPLGDCKAKWTRCTADSVRRFSAVAFFFGRELHRTLDVPIGLVEADWGGTPAEAWTSAEGLRSFPEFAMPTENSKPAEVGPGSPSALWNGMIAPLVPYGIRGVIWYQGEANRERAVQYRTLFPALIADWRRQFGRGALPFYFVQIAPFAYPGDRGEAALLREAQLRTLTIENTGMAVTMDIGDPKDIHPRKKQEVGRRLALWALAKTYGRDAIECSGPLPRETRVDGRTIRLRFDHVGRGLAPRDATLTCFTIAGADRAFVSARATIDGDTVVVSADSVAAPVAVRFAWGAADEPNLRNADGLPAPSFRTDDWD